MIKFKYPPFVRNAIADRQSIIRRQEELQEHLNTSFKISLTDLQRQEKELLDEELDLLNKLVQIKSKRIDLYTTSLD